MRTRLIVTAAVAIALAVPSSVGAAARSGAWKGQATSTEGDFKYGKVSFRVSGSSIRNLKIENVTVSGCGGLKNIVVPRLRIRGTKFSGTYKPVPGVDDTIIVTGTIRGSRATGKFTEGPTCEGKGKFTARAA